MFELYCIHGERSILEYLHSYLNLSKAFPKDKNCMHQVKVILLCENKEKKLS